MADDRVSLVPPSAVHLGVEREVKALGEMGISGPDALARAVEVTAAKIRNAAVLVEHQAHDGLCHACGAPLDDSRPVVAVMQASPGRPLWMHNGTCHDQHRTRRAGLVDEIMKAAGHGAGTTDGEAA
jgi:hypothetical protein